MGRGRVFRSGGVGRVWLSLALLRRGCTLGSVWSLVWSSWTWFCSQPRPGCAAAGAAVVLLSLCAYLPLIVCLSVVVFIPLALAVAIQHPTRSFPVTLATCQGSSAPGETPGREREKERERPKQSRVLPAAAHRTTLAVSIPPRQSQSYETLPYIINTAVVTRRLAVRPSNLQHGH